MRHTRNAYAVLGLVVALSYLQPGKAQESEPAAVGDERSIVQAVVESWHMRATDLNPILVKYRVRRFEASVFLAEKAQLQGDPLSEPVENLEYEGTSLLARKGTLFHCSYTGPQVAGGAIVDPKPTSSYWIFDGEQTVKFEDQAGAQVVVSGNPPRPGTGYVTPWSNAKEDDAQLLLGRWFDGQREGTVSLIGRSRLEDGTSVLKLRFVNSADWSFEISVLPDFAYALQLYEARNAEGHLAHTAAADWKLIQGIPSPMRSLSRTYDGAGQSVMTETEIAIEELTADPAEIPDRLFQADIPQDSPIFDEDLRTSVRDPVAAQTNLDQIQVGPSRGKLYYLLAFNVIVVACIVLLVLWRRLRSKKT